jgi:lysozyme
MSMVNNYKLRKMIENDEGRKNKLYKCSEGKWTIGVGHNIEDNGLPAHIIDGLYTYDLENAERDAIAFIGKITYERLSEPRRAVLVNMSFQLGLQRLSGFKRFRLAVINEEYENAAHEMLDSKYATQVPNRAARLAKIMETGDW